MEEQKLACEDPVTNACYVPNYQSIDELAELPGFLEALNSAFAMYEDDWLCRCIASPKVQALALASLI